MEWGGEGETHTEDRNLCLVSTSFCFLSTYHFSYCYSLSKTMIKRVVDHT